jgi:hypothetical protein
MNNTTITLDSEVLKDPQYHKIKEILQKLKDGGVLNSMAGNCISSSEILQHLLSQVGIPSKIVECQACLIRSGVSQANDIMFIGYDNSNYSGQIDTHAVVITETDLPLIIDLSLGQLLPNDHPYIIERVNGTKPEEIAQINVGNINITYFIKKHIRLHQLHQKTLLERMTETENLRRRFKLLEKLVYGLLCLVVVNTLLNTAQVYSDLTWREIPNHHLKDIFKSK